ncbi:MAG: hypothetical protein M9936_02655 [Caldilinea sp.]|nr:hypothetical protein [Caldilinea sp.]MCB0057823.1 hypothetical protein [Caldilineaceae bacterium]MCB0049993.1 hypothetical protein [Caldilinea sp.]MCB0134896.1 hypothetical protein [Caldilineaceae bacterium]MCB0148625.1 hypothetical protein [Caldilineaceae bacterium]
MATPFFHIRRKYVFPKLHPSNRQCAGLRAMTLIVWAGLGALLLWGPAHLLIVLAYLLTAALLPLGWPPVFGQWRAVIALSAGAMLPLAMLRIPVLYTPSPWLDVAMLLQLTAWLMLPATLALLLWRRRAAAAVILLGMALLPVSTLLLMQFGPPPTDLTAPPPVHPLAGMAMLTPFWLMLTSCMLGPLFFVVMFVWLLIREAIGEGEAQNAVV